MNSHILLSFGSAFERLTFVLRGRPARFFSIDELTLQKSSSTPVNSHNIEICLIYYFVNNGIISCIRLLLLKHAAHLKIIFKTLVI